MLELFSLPHSSANVERIFSQMNLNKTKTKNHLKEGTLNGILSSKEVIGSDCSRKKVCYEFEVTAGMLKNIPMLCTVTIAIMKYLKVTIAIMKYLNRVFPQSLIFHTIFQFFFPSQMTILN